MFISLSTRILKNIFYHHATIITSVFLNCLVLAMFSSCPTWFSCRIKQTRICGYKLNEPLSTMVIQGSCLVFDFDFPVKGLCWLAEGDWLWHQCKPPGYTLHRLMEMLFSVEEAKVKRLVPQWEQRMWEWHSTTSLLSVSQTAKRHRRRLLTLLIFHLLSVIPEVQTMNKNIKWNFFLINWMSAP